MRKTRAAIHLAIGALTTGCASGSLDPVTSIAHVAPLPVVVAQHGQSPRDQEWDIKDCQAEAGSKTNWSPTDSPLGNLFQKLFFWGTAGAALGGTVDGFPVVVDASTPSAGLIAGASAGGVTGAALSVSGQSRYERAWAACVRARRYGLEREVSHGAPR